MSTLFVYVSKLNNCIYMIEINILARRRIHMETAFQNSNYTGLVELYDRRMELYDVTSLGDLGMAFVPPIHLLCMTFLCPAALARSLVYHQRWT